MRPAIVTAIAAIPLLMTTAVRAQAPGPQTGPPSLQQLFNTASQAEQTGDCARALPIFNSLVGDPRIKPGSLAAGAIAVRRGHCLIGAGKFDEGEASLLAGLPIMHAAGPEFTQDVAMGERELGDSAFLRNDHDVALVHYQALLAVSSDNERVLPLLRLAMLTAFDGGTQPLGYAEEALRIASAAAKPDKKTLANIHDVHGRILLNQGQIKLAYAELEHALDLAGGLTFNRVSHGDVELRGDLAQAALLTGHPDEARTYLSYTGAGRIAESPFATAVSMEAPECGAESGLKPEDSAIVEFSIADDGGVTGAQTIYSRGNFSVATAFSKSVDSWFWRPEDIAKLPPFFRVLTRVEMRCSNRGGNVPSVETPLARRFFEWASRQLPQWHGPFPPEGANLPALKALGDAAATRRDTNVAAAALGAWALLNPRDGAAELATFDEALALGRQAAVPPEAINALRVLRMPRQLRVDHLKSGHGDTSLSDRAGFRAVAEEPGLASDPLASDTLLMLALPRHPASTDRASLVMLARRVADDGRLPEHFPLRQAAMLWLANQSAEAGKLDEAQAFFQRTGLNEQQCALIGPEPAMRQSGVSGADYPMDALRMGFEGWVRLEFNINANGTTAGTRPLIAYPPFVFADAATGMARSMRCHATYRPAGGGGMQRPQ